MLTLIAAALMVLVVNNVKAVETLEQSSVAIYVNNPDIDVWKNAGWKFEHGDSILLQGNCVLNPVYGEPHNYSGYCTKPDVLVPLMPSAGKITGLLYTGPALDEHSNRIIHINTTEQFLGNNAIPNHPVLSILFRKQFVYITDLGSAMFVPWKWFWPIRHLFGWKDDCWRKKEIEGFVYMQNKYECGKIAVPVFGARMMFVVTDYPNTSAIYKLNRGMEVSDDTIYYLMLAKSK